MSYETSIWSSKSLLTLLCVVSAIFALGGACGSSGDGQAGSGGESDVEICTNGIDDDDDVFTDCDDADCATHPECTGAMGCGGVTPGNGDKNTLCNANNQCDSNRCCTSVPGVCNNPIHICSCRDPR